MVFVLVELENYLLCRSFLNVLLDNLLLYTSKYFIVLLSGTDSWSNFWAFVLFGYKVLLGAFCPATLSGGHLENIVVVRSSGLGQGRTCFNVSWEPQGKIGNKISGEVQMSQRKFLIMF